MVEQYAGSLEYHRWRVSAVVDGVPVDPTADALSFALSSDVDATGNPVEPAPDTYVAGVWENPAPTIYLACLLCGPSGAIAPSRGTYYVWMKVADAPEVPVRLVDRLKVI